MGDDWFRVEVTDRLGQVVAIESEMLAGRDIGELERAVINRAIDNLCGFLGRSIQPYSESAHEYPLLAADLRAKYPRGD